MDAAVGDSGASLCGNGTCDPFEDCVACPSDCPCPCGNGICEGSETPENCEFDCMQTCGNGACNTDEDCSSCPQDCSCTCGDGMLTAPEQCEPPDGVTCDSNCNNIPVGAPIVAGNGLIVQDVSDDGAFIAYTDSTKTLFVVATSSGTPTQIAANVDRARYRGRYLTVSQELDTTGSVALTMLIIEQGSTTPTFTAARVNVRDVRASNDGNHIYYEQNQLMDSSLEDLFLNGQMIVQGARRERARFAARNDYLVVATDSPDPSDPQSNISVVRAFSLAGGPTVELAFEPVARRFDITPDGSQVIVGANENGPIADLTLVPIGGGNDQLLVAEVGDDGFRTTDDGTALVFLNPDDPNDPIMYGLDAIQLDGTGRRTILASGPIDILAISNTAVIYSTALDLNGLETFNMVRLDGTQNTMLGPSAVEEGFTSNGAHYLYRDQVQISGAREFGNLRAVDTSNGTITTLGDRVLKASRADATRVVFLSTSGVLQVTDLQTQQSEVIESTAHSFDLVPDSVDGPSSRVCFSIRSGAFAGIYLLNL